MKFSCYFFSIFFLLSCSSKTGVVEKFPNGNPAKIVEHFENDSSSEKIFYANGTLQEIKNFKKGKQTGKQISYRTDGSPMSIVTFSDGNRNGPMLEYYNSGKVSFEGLTLDGKWEGPGKSYFRSGKPSYIGSFHLGKDTGWSYYFNPQGDTTRITFRKSPEDAILYFNGKRKSITPVEWEKMADNELLQTVEQQ